MRVTFLDANHAQKVPGDTGVEADRTPQGSLEAGRLRVNLSDSVRGKRKPQVQTANLSYRGCTLRLGPSITMALIASRRRRRRRISNSTSLRRRHRTWRGIFRLRTPPVWGQRLEQPSVR